MVKNLFSRIYVNEQIKHKAVEFFEKHNWITLIPDLYRVKVIIDPEEACCLMIEFHFQNALIDIQRAVKYLKRELNCQKVGVVGFSLDGALALASTSVAHNQIGAASAYNRIPPPQIFDPRNINIPAIAHYDNNDATEEINASNCVDELAERVNDAGGNIIIYRYGAGHTFEDESDATNNNASETAERRTVEFLQ